MAAVLGAGAEVHDTRVNSLHRHASETGHLNSCCVAQSNTGDCGLCRVKHVHGTGSRQRTSDNSDSLSHLLGLSVTLVISVSDAATSRRASCDSVRGRPARDGVPPTPPPRGPSIRSDYITRDSSDVMPPYNQWCQQLDGALGSLGRAFEHGVLVCFWMHHIAATETLLSCQRSSQKTTLPPSEPP